MEHSDSEDESSLTQEQMDKLAQLQDLTGIEDTEVCRALLESQDWDLEGAARNHLGIPSEPNNENDRSENQVEDPPVVENNVPPRGSLGAVRRNQISRLPELLLFVVSLPIRIVSQSLEGAIGFLSSLFGFPPRRSNAVRDPVGDVRRFSSEFDKKYGTNHVPFHVASYSQVLDEAKKELRFLLVYLHSEDHQDTDRFCVETLSNSDVVRYVTENMICWGCSVRYPEGYRVSEALRESTYPFLAVIVLRQNRMVVVGRREGSIAPDAFITWLEKTIRDYEAFIVAARADRDERNFNREIRSEQEAVFAETLRQDQEREEQRLEEERKKQEAEELRKKAEEEERQRIEEEHERKNRIQRLKIDLAVEIPDEPDRDCAESIRILIKLPGGQRLERRFLPTHSLKHLYYFVFCHPDSPDEFDIVTNFPRRTLQCKPSPDSPEPPSLQEAGFSRSEMLFVNDLDA